MDRTTLLEFVSAIFTGHKQELTFRSLYATLAVGPVLITFVETLCHISGRPFDDEENLRGLPFRLQVFRFRMSGPGTGRRAAQPFE
jgi:hypothetical protein